MLSIAKNWFKIATEWNIEQVTMAWGADKEGTDHKLTRNYCKHLRKRQVASGKGLGPILVQCWIWYKK